MCQTGHMPFPQAVGKLTFSGEHGSNEIWSFGMHVGPVTMTEARMDDIELAARNFLSAGSAYVSSACTLTEIKYAYLDVNGRYADDDQPFIREVSPAEIGGGGSDYVPQATMVITLTTDSKRGLAHAGRFYTPPTSLQAGNSGLISELEQSGLADNYKGFLDAINAAVETGVIVASSRGAGAIRDVTGIKVGRVIDTQRRRRSALPEQYLARTLA